MAIIGQEIKVTGIVQGVGFRPFVYSLATSLQLTGWVRNTSSGVEIEINGTDESVSAFLEELKTHPPALARIDSIEARPVPPNGYEGFEIRHSQPQPGDFLPVSPDVCTCPDCLRELFDPSDRRYRYPFINCTNCGPRFTIVTDIPYDRPNTTMAGFPLCDGCRREYEDPLDRRFHAQPVACPRCGPQIRFEANGQQIAAGEDALQLARQWLREGRILAVKGLGGYHLACDASNPQAVAELRRRKRRSDKAFALMAFDLAAIERQAQVGPSERNLLESIQRPVVLLQRKPGSTVAAVVAPGLNTLGFMLPYTPLHFLLLEPEPGFPEVLVMTSGNLSEEPIAYQDEDACTRLQTLADGFLLHNRPIHMRVDDSVAEIVDGDQPYLIRRARGYAPDPVQLSYDLPPVLAAGAELKNTFCLTRGKYAFLSQHIGDLENYETLQSFEEGVRHYQNLFRVQPELIACDLHPDYLASRAAAQRAEQENLPLVKVQHHHAHLAACLADNHYTKSDPVIGLILDGTGLGTDGAVWGGEVLVGGLEGYRRAYHLKYVPLPGGDLAVRKPARMALSHLWAAGLPWEEELPPVEALCFEERTALRVQLEKKLNTPPTSSMGRLFDAASALISVRQVVNYEGQAAIELEALADPDENGSYPFDIQDGILDPAPLWEAMLADWRAGESAGTISARFHNAIADALLTICREIRSNAGTSTVALSGGVWQNRLLLHKTLERLRADRFTVLYHHRVPANDGGLALGQALIAAAASRNLMNTKEA